MSNAYTADELIASLKRRGMIPTSSRTLSNTDFLSFINDEIFTSLVPFIMSTREEYLVASSTESTVSGSAEYSLPERSIGGKLRDLQILEGSTYTTLERYEPGRLEWSSTDSSRPSAYSLEGNNVVLHPTPSGVETLRFKYFQRPNRCVLAEDAGLITSVGATTVVISLVPSDFGTGAADYDFIKGTGPGFECRAIDQSGTRSSTTLTFAGGVPDGVAVGDYVALAGQSPIPQIPLDLHPLLAQRCVARSLEALGFRDQAMLANATADRMQKNLLGLLTPRVEGASRYVIGSNAPGHGRHRRWRT